MTSYLCRGVFDSLAALNFGFAIVSRLTSGDRNALVLVSGDYAALNEDDLNTLHSAAKQAGFRLTVDEHGDLRAVRPN